LTRQTCSQKGRLCLPNSSVACMPTPLEPARLTEPSTQYPPLLHVLRPLLNARGTPCARSARPGASLRRSRRRRTLRVRQQPMRSHEPAHIERAAGAALDDAALGDDALDELRGRHVKARVPHLPAPGVPAPRISKACSAWGRIGPARDWPASMATSGRMQGWRTPCPPHAALCLSHGRPEQERDADKAAAQPPAATHAA